MFYASLSRMRGWARIARPHTGVPEIGRSMRAQPCSDHGGALPVVSFICENEVSGNALPFVRAMWRIQTPRFMVTQDVGGFHTPHRQYASQTTSRLIKLKNLRQGCAQ